MCFFTCVHKRLGPSRLDRMKSVALYFHMRTGYLSLCVIEYALSVSSVCVCPGVSPGQCSSEGFVRQVGHPVGAARENLDVFRAHSGPLH